MKSVLLFALSITIIKSSSAQIAKHNWLVAGTGYFNSTTSDIGTASGQKITNLQLSPNIGYFIIDKFASGLKLSFGRTRYKMKNQNSLGKYTTYSFGPFLRYYFLPVDKQFNLLIDGSYQYGIYRSGAATSTSNEPLNVPITQSTTNTFSVAAGPVIYFNSSVGLEFLVGYSTSNTSRLDGSTNIFQVGFGLQIHLEKEK